MTWKLVGELHACMRPTKFLYGRHRVYIHHISLHIPPLHHARCNDEHEMMTTGIRAEESAASSHLQSTVEIGVPIVAAELNTSTTRDQIAFIVPQYAAAALGVRLTCPVELFPASPWAKRAPARTQIAHMGRGKGSRGGMPLPRPESFGSQPRPWEGAIGRLLPS